MGEVLTRDLNLLEVKILYPFYGISLKARPKMCMLFSEKTSDRFSEKILERCFYLGRMMQKRSEDISEDFQMLQQEIPDLSSFRDYERKENLPDALKNFRRSYLNGFQKVPEFLLNPLEALIHYLDQYFTIFPKAQKVQPETENSDRAEEIFKMVAKTE